MLPSKFIATRLPELLRALPVIVGSVVISGWYFDILILKSVFPGFIMMNPLTAINFILLGLWLMFNARKPFNYKSLILHAILIALVISVAALLLTIAIKAELRLDKQFFKHAIGDNSMAPASMINFSLLTAAIYFSYRRDTFSIKLSQCLSFFVLYLTLIYACGYIFHLNSLTDSSVIIPMALHTTACFLAVGFSVLIIHPYKGFIKHFTQRSLGGEVARKVLPFMIIIPFLAGYIRLLGQRFQLYNTEFGTAMFVVSTVAFCGLGLLYYSKMLNRIDDKRTSIEWALRASEKVFSSIFINSKIGIALFDTKGKLIKVNKALSDILGYREQELSQYNFQRFSYPEDLENDISLQKKILEGAISSYHLEKRFIHKSGRVIWALLTVSAVKDENEDINYLIKQVIDISDRKSAESKLKKTSAENQQILDSSLDVICTINHEGKFIQVSKASKNVWGYEPEELTGVPYMDLVTEEDHVVTSYIARQITLGNPVTNFQNHYKKKDGGIVSIIWSAVWSETEKVMYCVAKDASERNKFEKELANERRKLEDLFRQAPSCIAVVEGPDFIFKQANVLYLEICGKHDITGKKFKDVFPELEDQGSYQRLESAYRSGELYSARESYFRLYKNHSKSLVDSYFDFVYQPYKNAKGLVEGIFIFANDVTAQVEARQKIEVSEKRYRELIQEMPGAVYTTDADGRIMLYNRAAVELWGREPQIGKDLWCGAWQMFTKSGKEILPEESPMASTIKERKPLRGIEMVIAKPNGELRDVQPHPFPLFDTAGNLQGAINMLIDITPHKKAEKALLDQQLALESINQKLSDKNKTIEVARKELSVKAKELELSNKYKSEFLANISHELRTPLNSVLVLASLLSENPYKNLNDKQLEYAHIIYKSGADLLTLINDILDLAKIEAGKLTIHKEKTLISAIVADMQQLFGAIADEKEILFSTTIGTGVPDYILTDKLRVEQIIKNLLSNAFKFTSKGGEITLTVALAEDGTTLKIIVADTGIGIEPEKKKMIFEAFQQANGSTSRQYGGTGLGLSISKELASKLDSTISVESEPNRGSIFTLSHPIKTGENVPRKSVSVKSANSSKKVEHRPAQLEGKKVLIVDDDIRNIYALSAVLGEYGMDYYAATSGIEAIRQINTNTDIDLILMDIMMPEMDGYEAIKTIRDNEGYKLLPIIALTAKAMIGDADKCIEAGASDYIAKPYDPKHLLSQINYWIGKSR